MGLSEDIRWEVSRFYHLDGNEDDLEGLWASTREWQSVLSANIVAIGNDGGGNQLLLSFEKDPPTIKLCIHDEGMRVIDVANSFGEFVDMLSEDPEML
jgi:hypothetical protein